jgi:hypothetical protein
MRDRLLTALVSLALLIAAATIATGGFTIDLPAGRISSHNLLRPAAVLLGALAIGLWTPAHRRRQFRAVIGRLQRRASAVAAALAFLTFLLGVRFGTYAATGADYYGYVSQAGLWRTGELRQVQPAAKEVPWPDAGWTFSPLGYRPGPDPATIVPTYPAGLPILMALAMTVAGPSAAYWVIPLLGGLAVWLTFVLGRATHDEATGLGSALLLMTSPVFLFYLMPPMSDVPVTAWWLLALVLALSRRRSAPFWSGAAVSAAILTRPNLLPLAVVIGAWIAADPDRSARGRSGAAITFALGVLPGCIAVAAINDWIYGTPLESGYGRVETIFALDRFFANLVRYPRWMVETETPLILLAFAAPWLGSSRPRAARLFLAFAAVLYLCYAFYLPFDTWTFLRFLMPAIPLLLILALVAFRGLIGYAETGWRLPFALAVVTLLAALRWDIAQAEGVFRMRDVERRFEEAAAFVRRTLPERAVVLTKLHSGSIRHYSGRVTLRWDSMPPEWLDRAVAFLRDRERPPYLLIDGSEEEEFRTRFEKYSPLAVLHSRVIYERGGPPRVRIFDLSGPSPPGP